MEISFRRDHDRPKRSGCAGHESRTGTSDPATPPQDVLDRHGATVLRPATAATFANAGAPRTTIYRTGVLQLPDRLLDADHRELVARLNQVLAGLGYRLATENVPPLTEVVPAELHDYLPYLRDLSRRVPLEVVAGSRARPVDAWLALQTLRAAALTEPGLAEAVPGIELEHLLTGAAWVEGLPSTDGHSTTGGGWMMLLGGRAPVDVIAPAPPRRTLDELGGRRRPVVAVLDTGVAAHPWLDGSSPSADDSFVVQDATIQQQLVDEEVRDRDAQPLVGTTEEPVYDSPLRRQLETHSGHGTFIAGIIRQAAPDAQVLSIRVMHDDGVVYENDLTMVLGQLLARVRAVQDGTAARTAFVDVISLSAGYYAENSDDDTYTSGLASIIESLAERGVLFVASAGNDSTARPCYPAAVSAESGDRPVVVSVGALNPNNTKAFFSNDGPWVRCWATGAAVISTFPKYNGGAQAAIVVVEPPPSSPRRRETIDPDDFRSGFATWSGTSFAAPLVAATLAKAILDEAAADSEVDVDYFDAKRVAARAANALRAVGWVMP